jgi:hypothetical protein
VVADWVDNAAIFDIEAGDFYNTGQLMLNEQGMFLLDHRFLMSGHPPEFEAGRTIALQKC